MRQLALNEDNENYFSNHRPTRNAAHKTRAKLVYSMLEMFFLLKSPISAQIIIELCHALDYPDTDENYIKKMKTKFNNNKKQSLISQLSYFQD
ncbi:hypothetical protein [Photobacterium sp. TLY01]|uniref:hypothetical protein n=1 Tax=Photobacterium sp. TLY01 TaxID=2907534 RepID=UPI001F2E705E|nr:hypothetical protein [Photobacterium sp. TLY01]UIP27771.1 hypothetical protein LN341_14480 [Photobacterium sp. TLY01]